MTATGKVRTLGCMNTHPSRRRLLANGSLLGVTAVWGATFTLTKNAIADIPVFPYLAVRFAIAALVLAAGVLLSPQRRRKIRAKTWLHGGVLGLLLYGAYALQTLGLDQTSPSMAGFLTGLSVILVPLLSVPLLRQKQPVRTWVGALAALIGLAFLCGIRPEQLTAGQLEVLGCAVFVALQVLYTDGFGAGEEALVLAAVEILVLALLCAVTVPWTHSSGAWHWQAWAHPAVVEAVLICAIPGTAIAYWAQNRFQQDTSASEVAIIFTMEPVFAAVISWLVNQERLSLPQCVGAVFIVGSMLIADPNVRLPLCLHPGRDEVSREYLP
ncbi:membrane protein [Alicyclobacillus contaminans]|nr:membrane protein [Alicyclobacillus contaminans]